MGMNPGRRELEEREAAQRKSEAERARGYYTVAVSFNEGPLDSAGV